MSAPNAKQRQAFDDGAHAKRGGQTEERTLLIFGRAGDPDPLALRHWAQIGWHEQKQNPSERVNYHFYLNSIKRRVAGLGNHSTKGNTMRTEDELNKLREEYRPAYDEYANGAPAGTVTPFDEAFAAHLEALDAEAAGATTTEQTGAKGKGKGGKATGAAKPKAFRPTSDDRKTLNAAAAAALKAAKTEGTPRLKPTTGTYSDFLSGKVLKLDKDGNGSATLNVATASAMGTVVGQVDVTVKKGVMTAKGRKA